MKTDSPTRARPTGTLYWTKSGWRARLLVTVDGERVKKSFDLKTTNKAAARLKLKRLAAEQAEGGDLKTEAERLETFEEAAIRIVEASKIRSKPNRLARLRLHVYPQIGQKSVDTITAGDVREILIGLAEQGVSRDLVVHVKHDIGAVLRNLWQAEILPENIVAKVDTPDAFVDRRERVVLDDHELREYLAWQHPHEAHRMSVLERQTMACISRMFGGVRMGDLMAFDWSAFETAGGKFERGWAPRVKTLRPQLLEVPEMLRPILRDWWERHGRPTDGPVFPVRKGKRAGEPRKRASVAEALRRDLRRAFGIEVSERTEVVRANGRKTYPLTWVEARPLTPRERELFEETEFTKPVEFHSFRRGFKQALADAGVDWQQASALSGASDPKAHQRYLQNTAKMRSVPTAALPALGISDIVHVSTDTEPVSETDPPNEESPAITGPFNVALQSGRRDSNPRRQPWQGCTLPLSYSREGAKR